MEASFPRIFFFARVKKAWWEEEEEEEEDFLREGKTYIELVMVVLVMLSGDALAPMNFSVDFPLHYIEKESFAWSGVICVALWKVVVVVVAVVLC